MKYRNLIVLLISGFFLGGCAITGDIPSKTMVRKVAQGMTAADYAMYYSLPRTVFDVEVVVDKKVTKPGPFAAYAERFLGITGVPTRETTVYSISEIRVNTHPEKDPDQMYRIETEGKHFGARVSLTPDGLIRGINLPVIADVAITQEMIQKLGEKKFDAPEYPDLTMKKNTEPLPDTIFRVVRTDTSFIRIPLIRKTESQKTMMEQAKEAADNLMLLRTGRFKLLNGQYAYEENDGTRLPENGSLDLMVKELAVMEDGYLSLFAGRSQTNRTTYKFVYIPTGQGLVESTPLFAFTPQNGIEPPETGGADRVILQLSRDVLNPMDQVQWADEDPKAPKVPGLAYRIPEKAKVEINRSGEVLFTREFLVAQCGRIDFVPAGLLKDESTAVEFYPAYGSIKNIFRR
jgi:hypothetical protein